VLVRVRVLVRVLVCGSRTIVNTEIGRL
jgi:hypothetical protein